MATVVCWGELLWDVFDDETVLGGAAANVAWHLARLGDRAVLVSRVGRDELGRRAVDRLARAGVDVSFVQVDDEAPTGTVRVSIVDGEPRFRIGEKAAWDRIAFGEALAGAVAGADALVYGTLAQRTELASEALSRALATARGLRVCDLNLRPPHDGEAVIRRAIARADLVKVNEDERAVVDRLGIGVDGLLATARWVAATRGARGATLYAHGATLEHPGFPSTAAGDAVGCGDAFTATLVHGLVAGRGLDDALARANRYAAFVAGQRGAMPEVPQSLVDAVA